MGLISYTYYYTIIRTIYTNTICIKKPKKYY